MSKQNLDFWFEFASSYSYLSVMRIEALAREAKVTVVWRPFLLGPVSITLSKGKDGKGKDVLGFVFEYFLGQFADAEGKKGGQFYTPQSIVKILVDMLAPEPEKRVYDGACGSGGMFVQSERFIEMHEHRKGKISIFGQESNPTTYKLAKMNLAIRGIDAKIELGDTFHNDRHKDLKADYIIANPPFNISDWGGEQLQDSHMWKYGVPSVGNANYGWLRLFINKLSPTGTAGIVATCEVRSAVHVCCVVSGRPGCCAPAVTARPRSRCRAARDVRPASQRRARAAQRGCSSHHRWTAA